MTGIFKPSTLAIAMVVGLGFAPLHAQRSARHLLLGDLLGLNAGKKGVGELVITAHATTTKDGWDLALKRYLRVGAGEPKAAVILCHGFNINHLFWDIDPSTSLARYLAMNGYDVWVPDLRGSGDSSKPIISKVRGIVKFDVKEVKKIVPKKRSDLTKTGWTIDDHIRYDAPAIVDYVRGESGFDRVYWVGHSMGGIIGFGYVQTGDQNKIAGIIPIGSMMIMPNPLTPTLRKIADQKKVLTASLIINTTVASQLSNYTMGKVRSSTEVALLERSNMNKSVLFRFFRSCIDDTSAGVVGQFSNSIAAGGMMSKDGRFNYAKNLDRVNVPILFAVGKADGFVTEGMLRANYNAVSSEDKKIIVFSKANGHANDYGHCDLIIGQNSRKDLYPSIVGWLNKRTIPEAIPVSAPAENSEATAPAAGN